MRRLNPNLIKTHRSYTAGELAVRLGVHKNTIRHWLRHGLTPVDNGRPVLFQGAQVRVFLAKRNRERKQPCGPGTLYCVRCRRPRRPALAMAEYVEIGRGSGNLRALCEVCETLIHRRARRDDLLAVMPEVAVQIREAPQHLIGRSSSSLNCDFERQSAT